MPLNVGTELFDKIEEYFFNPSSSYKPSLELTTLINGVRKEILNKLGDVHGNLYFTSGATESNNWVFFNALKNKKNNVVTTLGEHDSVFETAKAYQNLGFDVRFASLNKSGGVDVESLLSLIDENTSMVSVIHVSNETGVINDIGEISKLVKEKNSNTLFHSDGVQAFCKVKSFFDYIDFYSISAHKVGGFKGVGALYVDKNLKIKPMINGGGQESGVRSGTENVPGILSFSYAIKNYNDINCDLIILANQLSTLMLGIEGVELICETNNKTPCISAFSIKNVRAEILQSMAADCGLFIGRGSACSSKKKNKDNRVLSAVGLTQSQIDGSIRISLSPQNTLKEIEEAVKILKNCIINQRSRNIG